MMEKDEVFYLECGLWNNKRAVAILLLRLGCQWNVLRCSQQVASFCILK